MSCLPSRARWMLLFLALSTGGCLPLHGGATGEPAGSDLVLVFVDVSGSIPEEDWAAHRRTLERLLDGSGLDAGDRLVLATVDGATFTRFAPLADVELPDTGIVLNDLEAAQRAKDRVRAAFEQARERPPAKRTHLLDALNVAAQVYAADAVRTRRHLVFLSDMVEESEHVDLSRGRIDEDAIASMIERRRGSGLVPDLRGVRVHASGASAATAERLLAIERFWRAYLAETGAACEAGMFVRGGLRVDLRPGSGA